MTYNFLSQPNRFKPRQFKEFSGGCSHTRFNHNEVPPSLSARLIRSYCGRVKVFRRSSDVHLVDELFLLHWTWF